MNVSVCVRKSAGIGCSFSETLMDKQHRLLMDGYFIVVLVSVHVQYHQVTSTHIFIIIANFGTLAH